MSVGTPATNNLPRWRPPFTSGGKPKSGFWYVWHDGKQVALTRFGAPKSNKSKADKAAALDARSVWLESVASDRVAAEIATHRVATISDCCQAYQTKKVVGASKAYQQQVKGILGKFCNGDYSKYSLGYAGWGSLPASKLTTAIVNEWISKYPGWKKGGQRNALTMLRAALQFAATEEGGNLIPACPVKLKPGKAAVREYEISTEEDKLIRQAAADCPAFLRFYSACIELGCRPSELAKLQAKHWNPKTEEFVLSASEWKNGKKTGKPRSISLTPEWVAWVRGRLEEMRDGEFIFRAPRAHRWIPSRWVDWFSTVREKAGVNPKYSLYCCRHTFITRALRAGASPADIANQTGTSIEMIQTVYSKLWADPTSRKKVVMAVACGSV